ncbi:hypothetical protein [Streptomyces sp. NPDC055709]
MFASAPLSGGELIGTMTAELVRFIDPSIHRPPGSGRASGRAVGSRRVARPAVGEHPAHRADALGTAARGRLSPEHRELSAILDSDAGRFAELVIIAELFQSGERGDNLELVPALRERAREVWRRMATDEVAGS